MAGIIVYKSKYGSTRQYAEWLQSETGFDLFESRHCPRDLSRYDVVVLGCSVLAGHLTLAGWIRSHWASLRGKRVVLFFTHLTQDENAIANVLPQSLPTEMASQLKAFPVGGRYLVSRMGAFDRLVIKMVASLQKDPKIKAELLTDQDRANKENLRDILAAVGTQA